MKKNIRRFLQAVIHDERGSQILEFILVFPLVWLLIMFSFDQFSILYNKQKAMAAAYEAGRIAAVQPNFGLATYHAAERGEAELSQGIGVTNGKVRLQLEGKGWEKGNHLRADATVSFRLLATGKPYEITESYYMMIENAEAKK
ncbi:TadE/TadG family type IV pilus assembly protein [Brevibacillus reuszeri]|uniref:TadE/TadG family type IV pilus assembly protein n=1 Tax=Brevibacillus reuszeri TaxID=54915 RepID=UPI00289A1F5B|nr:TadE/TadG family type IV pilus assembly protein [Brevibacillus reuszeri]